jgi:hypothetical protein
MMNIEWFEPPVQTPVEGVTEIGRIIHPPGVEIPLPTLPDMKWIMETQAALP